MRIPVGAFMMLQGGLTFVFIGLPVLALSAMDTGRPSGSGLVVLALALPLLTAATGLAIAIAGRRAWLPALAAEIALFALFAYAVLRSEALLGRILSGVVAGSALALTVGLVLARRSFK